MPLPGRRREGLHRGRSVGDDLTGGAVGVGLVATAAGAEGQGESELANQLRAIESGAFVVSAPQYIPGSAFPADFPLGVMRPPAPENAACPRCRTIAVGNSSRS